MENIIIFGLLGIIILLTGVISLYIYRINTRIGDIGKTLEHQYALIVKIQSVLKNKSGCRKRRNDIPGFTAKPDTCDGGN